MTAGHRTPQTGVNRVAVKKAVSGLEREGLIEKHRHGASCVGRCEGQSCDDSAAALDHFLMLRRQLASQSIGGA